MYYKRLFYRLEQKCHLKGYRLPKVKRLGKETPTMTQVSWLFLEQ